MSLLPFFFLRKKLFLVPLIALFSLVFEVRPHKYIAAHPPYHCRCGSCSVVSDSLQPHKLEPPGSSVYGNSPGKSTEVGSHALLRGIFPSPGIEPGLLHCRQILYCLSHLGSPYLCSPPIRHWTSFLLTFESIVFFRIGISLLRMTSMPSFLYKSYLPFNSQFRL